MADKKISPKEALQISYDFYKGVMDYYASSSPNKMGFQSRSNQAKILVDLINEKFEFEKIICIETGCSCSWEDGAFGSFLGRAVKETGGSFYSVDIDSKFSKKSEELFETLLPGLERCFYVQDSVKYLESVDFEPNLVHLDSWDFQIDDPFPPALHGWLEFQAIKDKMPSGSIVIVDDNYIKGTWIEWRTMGPGGPNDVLDVKKYDIDYPIVGKGAHIFQWCLREDTEWDVIGNHYLAGPNIKVIVQKR